MNKTSLTYLLYTRNPLAKKPVVGAVDAQAHLEEPVLPVGKPHSFFCAASMAAAEVFENINKLRPINPLPVFIIAASGNGSFRLARTVVCGVHPECAPASKNSEARS